ncbi:MAG: hypothetical protein ACETWK_10605, partial [Candidatus Aminicenantaceae bacterium]
VRGGGKYLYQFTSLPIFFQKEEVSIVFSVIKKKRGYTVKKVVGRLSGHGSGVRLYYEKMPKA